MLTLTVPDRILIVDDAPEARAALEAHLQQQGYEVLTAASADDAHAILARQKIGCMIAEARLFSAGSGELLSKALTRDADLAVLVLSSRPDVADAVHYLQYGALDYLAKPLDLPSVEASVQRALRRRVESIRERAAARLLRDELVNLGAQLARERAKVEDLTVATLESLVCVVEARDPWFAGHGLRVAQMAASIAAELGRTDEEVETVRRAGLLHDIGMICVPEELMVKQSSLTPREFEQVKRHVIVGHQILAPLPQLGQVGAFVRSHHEHWDGQGYPDALVGEHIPWGARLIGAAEVYDAFTTARPYRDQLTPEMAVEEMYGLIGTMLAPEVHRALSAVVERGRALVFVDEERGKEPGLEGPQVRAAS
ncbi:MAG TPA: HD domain-containing phosphohydrolase [Gemmatimonadales bacterium]|nr:HD domain-containing phosphohydrolase [Gemmatimonadales bacterium]